MNFIVGFIVMQRQVRRVKLDCKGLTKVVAGSSKFPHGLSYKSGINVDVCVCRACRTSSTFSAGQVCRS